MKNNFLKSIFSYTKVFPETRATIIYIMYSYRQKKKFLTEWSNTNCNDLPSVNLEWFTIGESRNWWWCNSNLRRNRWICGQTMSGSFIDFESRKHGCHDHYGLAWKCQLNEDFLLKASMFCWEDMLLTPIFSFFAQINYVKFRS